MERNFEVMKRKQVFLGIAALSLLLVCGCQKSSGEVFLAYDPENEKSIGVLADPTAQEEKLMSEELCVIPEKKAQDEDAYFTSDSQLLVELDTNQKLYASQIYNTLYPASITKIMTAYVALKYGNLEDEVTISYEASHIEEVGAKKCGLAEGDVISLEVLLNSFLVYSGNDAGIAIAEHISGSVEAFADQMNEEALKLGATGSHFVNPHGLHADNHYTTCYDIYLVFQELIKDERFVSMIRQGSYVANFKDVNGNDKSYTYTSTDRYLTGMAEVPEGATIIGGKTGTTDQAGSCLILYFEKNGKDYLAFLFHASDGDQCFDQMSHLIDKAG